MSLNFNNKMDYNFNYHIPNSEIINLKNSKENVKNLINYKSPKEIERLSNNFLIYKENNLNDENIKVDIKELKNEYKNINLKKFSWDDFEIGTKLGNGKLGEVFLAREKKTNYIVALKILNKDIIKKYNAQKQIVREIKIHSFLNHPNIIKLYGLFHDKNNIYLILEYANNGEIYKELRNEKNFKFSEEKASKYIKQIIEGLIYLHKNNIIHRDLKPENLLKLNDKIKICDFGWSIYAPELSLRDTFCGTLNYIPPEMVDGYKYDKKTDNWSIGIIIYEFLVGKSPFDKNSQIETLNCIKNCKINFPNFLSKESIDFISKFLKFNPNERIDLNDSLKHSFILNHNLIN